MQRGVSTLQHKKRRYLELREMSEDSKSGWPIEDISELTRQLKDEERRPIIGWFSIDNQDFVFSTDAAPQRVPDICGIAFCMRGSADIAMDGRKFHIAAGDMCAIFPNTLMQTFGRSSDFECRVLVVDASIRRAISVSAAMKILLYIHEHPCTSLNPEEAEALRGYMQSLYMLLKRPDHIYREEIAERLIIAFCYEVAAIYHRGNALAKEERTRQEYIFYEFMELLAEHYTTERQVKFYADRLCISPKYFSSIVKSVSGKSAADWITDMVIRNAVSMLADSRQTVQQVSNALNFPNPSFFAQYFKRATGKTPKEFRQRK